MKQLPSRLILTALLLVSLVTPAAALVIQQTAGYVYNSATATWNLENVAWGFGTDGTLDGSRVLTFNKFDGSLGTLLGASLKVYTKASGTLTVTNTSSSTSVIRGLMNGVHVSYAVPLFGQNFTSLDSSSYASFTQRIILSGGAGFATGDALLTAVLNPDGYRYDRANAAFFVGTAGATFNIPIGATNEATITYTGGNPVITFTNKAAVYATLEYTYEAATVPEPSTCLLLGISLGVLALVRKSVDLKMRPLSHGKALIERRERQ